jgi:hypothetical protein
MLNTTGPNPVCDPAGIRLKNGMRITRSIMPDDTIAVEVLSIDQLENPVHAAAQT